MKTGVGLIIFAFAGRLLAADALHATDQRPDGRIVLLASNAVVHGATIRYEPQPHKNTIGFWTKAEDWVSWEFKVNTPGKFDVTLTQSCGKGSGGSKVAFSLAGQTIEDVVPETGSFTSWTNRSIGSFNLSTAGIYTVMVKPLRKPGLAVMDLRALEFTPKK
jgi:hypothetical protein